MLLMLLKAFKLLVYLDTVEFQRVLTDVYLSINGRLPVN